MSQITVQIILRLVWLIVAILEKAARLVNTIIDICDDGVINGSFDKPTWYVKLQAILQSLSGNKESIECLTDEIRSSVVKVVNVDELS